MLISIILRLLSLAGVAMGTVDTVDVTRDEVIASPRVAQVRLAETLAEADSIHSVSARGKTITFAITRGDKSFQVIATTRTKHAVKGEVVGLAVVETRPLEFEGGGLSWLGAELERVTAISRLVVDEDGAVTITTSDGRRYMAIPGRGSGGNAAVESRWAAAWSGSDS